MRQTKNFNEVSDPKLVCSCCGKGELSVATFILLEVVREWTGTPVSINSACRCEEHNRAVGGAEDSEHLFHDLCEDDIEATATDIVVQGKTPKEVYDFLDSLPYSNLLGLGLYEDFTHVDTRGFKARW